MNTAQLQTFCTEVRRDIINMTANAGSGHPGGSLSAVELMSAIFCTQMRIDPKNPKDPDRDRFVLSKGHAAPCYYGILAELGFFSKDEFKTFRQLHGMLQGHPDMKHIPGVDMSSGSLGQGVSCAAGMAKAAKYLKKDSVRVYTLLGDGEIEEGEVWEAFMFAAKYALDNFCVIIDLNGLQIDGPTKDVMNTEPVDAKMRDFGFEVVTINGHDVDEIEKAFDVFHATSGKPTAILMHTTKGKGVSFMENQVGWHGKAPNDEEYKTAMDELNAQMAELEAQA